MRRIRRASVSASRAMAMARSVRPPPFAGGGSPFEPVPGSAGFPAPPSDFGAFDETDPAGFGFGFPLDGEGAFGSPPSFDDESRYPFDMISDGAGVAPPPFALVDETAPPVPVWDATTPDAVSDDLSPGVFGKKGAQTYQNLTGALDGIAGVADENAGKGAEGAQAIADAVSEAPTSQGDAVGVTVYASDDIRAAKEFLEDNGVAIRHSGRTYLEAFVPARLLGALSEQKGVIRVERIIPPAVSQVLPNPCETTDLGSAAEIDASGTWVPGCASTARAGSYSRFYQFTAPANSIVAIWLESDAADAYLYLRSGTAKSGASIEEDDDSSEADNGDSYIYEPVSGGRTRLKLQPRTAASKARSRSSFGESRRPSAPPTHPKSEPSPRRERIRSTGRGRTAAFQEFSGERARNTTRSRCRKRPSWTSGRRPTCPRH